MKGQFVGKQVGCGDSGYVVVLNQLRDFPLATPTASKHIRAVGSLRSQVKGFHRASLHTEQNLPEAQRLYRIRILLEITQSTLSGTNNTRAPVTTDSTASGQSNQATKRVRSSPSNATASATSSSPDSDSLLQGYLAALVKGAPMTREDLRALELLLSIDVAVCSPNHSPANRYMQTVTPQTEQGAANKQREFTLAHVWSAWLADEEAGNLNSETHQPGAHGVLDQWLLVVHPSVDDGEGVSPLAVTSPPSTLQAARSGTAAALAVAATAAAAAAAAEAAKAEAATAGVAAAAVAVAEAAAAAASTSKPAAARRTPTASSQGTPSSLRPVQPNVPPLATAGAAATPKNDGAGAAADAAGTSAGVADKAAATPAASATAVSRRRSTDQSPRSAKRSRVSEEPASRDN